MWVKPQNGSSLRKGKSLQDRREEERQALRLHRVLLFYFFFKLGLKKEATCNCLLNPGPVSETSLFFTMRWLQHHFFFKMFLILRKHWQKSILHHVVAKKTKNLSSYIFLFIFLFTYNFIYTAFLFRLQSSLLYSASAAPPGVSPLRSGPELLTSVKASHLSHSIS